MTRIAKCYLKSLSPYSQSRPYELEVDKLPDETAADYERRTWREKCHYNTATGEIFIPASQFSSSLKEAAKYISDDLKIEGAGKARYTKNFEAGVIVMSDLPIGIKKDEVAGKPYLVSPQGKRGPGPRVMKMFPEIYSWEGYVEYILLDDKIPKDVFELVLRTSGNLIGIGRYRPRNWGSFGRFSLAGEIEWREE